MLDLEKNISLWSHQLKMNRVTSFGLPCCLLWCFTVSTQLPWWKLQQVQIFISNRFFSDGYRGCLCLKCIVFLGFSWPNHPLEPSLPRCFTGVGGGATSAAGTAQRGGKGLHEGWGQVGLDINRIASECAPWLSYSAKERCWRASFCNMSYTHYCTIGVGERKQDNLGCD